MGLGRSRIYRAAACGRDCFRRIARRSPLDGQGALLRGAAAGFGIAAGAIGVRLPVRLRRTDSYCRSSAQCAAGRSTGRVLWGTARSSATQTRSCVTRFGLPPRCTARPLLVGGTGPACAGTGPALGRHWAGTGPAWVALGRLQDKRDRLNRLKFRAWSVLSPRRRRFHLTTASKMHTPHARGVCTLGSNMHEVRCISATIRMRAFTNTRGCYVAALRRARRAFDSTH